MKAIIFDFDGTIADSFDVVADFLARRASKASISQAQRAELRGITMARMAVRLGNPRWRLPFLLFEGQRDMGRHMSEVPPVEGMIEVLTALHGRGYQLYIVSTNSAANVAAFLHQYKLEDYFTAVYANAGLPGKARVLRRLMRRERLRLADCIYIGDETTDIRSARRAGMAAIAVSWGYMTAAALQVAKPLAVVDGPMQLLECFTQDISAIETSRAGRS